MAQRVKNPPAMQETQVHSLGWEDSPGEGNANSLQYSCLENSMDRGAWQAVVHGVAKSQTRLSNFTHIFTLRVPKKHPPLHLWAAEFLTSVNYFLFFHQVLTDQGFKWFT